MKADAQKTIDAIQWLEAHGFAVIDIGGPVRRATVLAMAEAQGRSSEKRSAGQSQTIRAAEARMLLGVAMSTFWRYVKEEKGFPKGRRMGPRSTVWDRDEIKAWLASRPFTSK